MSYDFKIENGDWKIGSNGDIAKVENTEKLIQDILKICIFPLGKNVFFKWYGSPISKSLIGNVMNDEFSSTIASNQLASSIQTLQSLQQEQAKRQRVSPFEQIYATKSVKIERNQVDPRYYGVFINVLTKALTEISTQFGVNPTMTGL